MFQMLLRPLSYHFYMLVKGMLRLEETGCENTKANDLHHFCAGMAQDVLHWAMLLVSSLVTVFLNELWGFN